MEERGNPRRLAAEEFLAKLEMNEMLAPLARVFRGNVVPESIRVYKRMPEDMEDVIGVVNDPDADLVLKLSEWIQGVKLGFYFASAKTLREKPEVLLEGTPNFSVLIDPPSPLGRGFDEVRANVSIDHLNLSSGSARALLQILTDISSHYVGLNRIRREMFLSLR